MTVALPLPYEDELLYSTIARYMELLAVDKPTNVIRMLFGRFVRPSADTLCGLGELARQTYDSWGLSSREIADTYTLLPYYASYAQDHARTRAYEAMLGDGEAKAASFLGHVATRVQKPQRLQFCEQCSQEDVAKHGETYWRRSHQLPGVFVCLKHLASLCESEVHTNSRSAAAWHSGHTSIMASMHSGLSRNSQWDGNSHVLEVARRSVDLLECFSTQSFPSMNVHYLSLARAAGLTRPSGIVDIRILSREMRTMYGQDFLSSTGLSASAEQKITWPRDMMSRADASFQPLQHIVLSLLLENCKTSVKGGGAQLTASQSYSCPNPYAAHGAGHIIERVKVGEMPAGLVGGGGRIGRASCSCGLKFSFWGCRAGTIEPEMSRVNDFGQDWRQAVHTMRHRGTEITDIAKEMGLAVETVKAMLMRGQASRKTVTQADILRWRSEWNRLLASVAPLGHEAARKLNDSLYNRLNRHDKSWFRKSGSRSWQKARALPRRPKVDWPERDRLWSQALRAAAAKLYSSSSRLHRVSKAAIVSEAGFREFSSRERALLPLSQSALTELAESTEQFVVLRLERAAQHFHVHGDSFSTRKLLARAGVDRYKTTSLVRTTIERIVDEFGRRSLLRG